MPKLINQTDAATPIVDQNGVPTQAFYQLLNDLVSLEIVDGEGDPNGQLKAREKTLYFDTNGASGSILYIKTTDISDDGGWVSI